MTASLTEQLASLPGTGDRLPAGVAPACDHGAPHTIELGEPRRLRICDEQGLIGTITLSGGTLTGSGPGTQTLASTYLRKSGGDTEAAYQALLGMTTGYVWAEPWT